MILTTADAGRRWTEQNPGRALTDAQLQDVDFVNRLDGWAVGIDLRGTSPLILATADGGRMSTAEGPGAALRGQFNAVSFADPRHGWAVGY